MTSSPYAALSFLRHYYYYHQQGNANVLLPNGNGAPAALANTAAANNPPQPPPPQAEPKPNLVVNWNSPGGSFSGYTLDEHFPLV
ncbi:hypothetical protein FRC18_007896 [Serendipita sp. 400]|nr:hypothetical protein FRC18_007896 [Serendipita sp. 400]